MRYLISILFILLSDIPAYSQTSDNKAKYNSRDYILILNSYSYGNNRTTRLSKTLRKKLEAEDTNLVVNITYANIGNRHSYQSDRFGMQSAFSSASINKTVLIPNVLILIGDESWMLYRDMNLRGVWERVPVVLCDISEYIMADYRNFYRKRDFADSLMVPIEKSQRELNVAGIITSDNTDKTLELITHLIPAIRRIDYISTRNYKDEHTLYKLRKSIVKRYPNLSLNVLYQTPNNKDSVKLILSSNDNKSAIVIRTQELDPEIDKPTFVLNQHTPTDSSSIVGGYVALDEDMCTQVAKTAYDIFKSDKSSLATPYIHANRYANVLDQTVVERFTFKEQADKLTNLIYINTPEPFFIRHFVLIMTIAIIIVATTVITIIVWRSRRNSTRLVKSYESYKGLYNEYRAVYDNMPIGMILFDKNGYITNHNIESTRYLDTLQTYGLSTQSRLTEIQSITNPDFETLYHTILDEDTAQENTLMLVIDKSEVRRENQAKQKILDTMIFAIDSSGWGVAQYNIVDNRGFATKNWYKNLSIKESDRFEMAYNYMCEADSIKVKEFLHKVCAGEADTFIDTILADQCGEQNWLQYAIKVLKFAPDQGQILIVELMININDQKEREQKLAIALTKALESYTLKNAFIANTGHEVREVLNQMNDKIEALLSSLDTNEQERYAKGIEHDNATMLQILKTTISVSRPNSPQESSESELMK